MSNYAHLRRMAAVASNEDEDALLWALHEIDRLRADIKVLSETLNGIANRKDFADAVLASKELRTDV